MRIAYLTQWFDPEPNIVKGIAFVQALQADGHRVTVITGFPNYPTGRLYPGYRLRLIQRETVDGIEVVRLPLYPSHDRSSFRRSLNYISFCLSALAYLLLRRRSYDMAYVYHPPITVGLAAALSGIVRPMPFVLDVQDLWPDTIPATGMTGAKTLVGVLGALCRFVYRRASAIIVQSDGMRQALLDRGVPEGKLCRIFNWADVASALVEMTPAPAPSPNASFTVVYGGNLGRAQGIETIVDAAATIQRRRQDIEIKLYGDGIEEARLRERAASLGLTNLRFEGRVPKARIIPVFERADALLMHLATDPLFTITIPSKTQFYLAMGRPVVAGVAGDGAHMLLEAGMSVVAPGDSAALARAICDLADLPAAARDAIGRAGRRYYRERLSFERGMAETLALLRGIYAEGRQREAVASS